MGLTVAEVSPEAGVGGPLALVRNGDLIRVDVDAARLDLEVAADVLATRQPHVAPTQVPATGYLGVYRRSVQPMSTGAVLVDPEGRRERG